MGCGAVKVAPQDGGVTDPLPKSPLLQVVPDAGAPTKPDPSTFQPTTTDPGNGDGSLPMTQTPSTGSRTPAKTNRMPSGLTLPLLSKLMTSEVLSGSPQNKASTPSPKAETMSADVRRLLLRALSKHFLFSALQEDERASLLEQTEPRIFDAGEVVFSQGQQGDGCYLIQTGLFSVTVDDRLLKQLKSKQSFGELAVLYGVARTATVACVQKGTVWRLPDEAMREWLLLLNGKHIMRLRQFLSTDPGFRVLSDEDRETLAAACSVQVFAKGEQILREGEVADWMFVVMEGNVQTVDRYGNTVLKQPGTILGVMGVMYTQRHLLGAKALDSVICLALSKSSVIQFSGPLEQLLRRNAIKSLLECGGGGAKAGELEFFRQLFPSQQDVLIESLEDVSFAEGDFVLEHGAASQFTIIRDGEVAVITDTTVIEAGGGGLNLKEYAAEVLSSGSTFGGKALEENTPLQASLIALSPTTLHRVSHATLAAALGHPLTEVMRLNEIKKVLADVFLFKNLPADALDSTIRCMQRRRYSPNDVIVKQGDEATHFYLIQSGSVKVMKDGVKVRSLGRWDFFGERGLLLQEKRSATCQAEVSCVLLVLEAKTFGGIVGLFRKELEQRMYLQDLDITMHDLRLTAVVGRGTFGIVKRVCHEKDRSKVYALKCLNKEQVKQGNSQNSILMEREINAQCYHPCIVQFIKTFQDQENIYFLTEFLGGGDLFYAIREIGTLTKEHAQFYSGSIVLALQYLHGRGIMYRDLKPENVLLDFEGHAKLVDFGSCKKALRSMTLVGTPEYLAPEVILGRGYSCAIDWWALGVILHEFIVGPLPFGKDPENQIELFREILEAPLTIPDYVTDESATAILTGLLERVPEMRLCSSSLGAKELQEHRYYANFDWGALAGLYLAPPWVPRMEKVQGNWEMHSGEPLVAEDAEPFDPSTLGEDMEWALGF